MVKKLFSFYLLVLALCSVLQTQAMEQEIQAFCERYFVPPKALGQTKKLTSEVHTYLEKLQTAVSILDLQAEQIKHTALITQLTDYKNKSWEAFNSFRPQSLIPAGNVYPEENSREDGIVNFIPQTSEACVIFLRYKHLFCSTKLPLSKELVQLTDSLTLSSNQELHDIGTLLFYNSAINSYSQQLQKRVGDLTEVILVAKKYIDYHLLSYRKKFPEFEPYMATATRFLKVFDKFYLTGNKLDAYTTLIKQFTIIFNLYKTSEASVQLLYSFLYQQLQQAYNILINAGVSNNKIIKYKMNVALNRPLPQTLPLIQDIAPIRQFEEVYQELKQENHNAFSFLDITKLPRALNQSHKFPHNQQALPQESKQSQTQEIPEERDKSSAKQVIYPKNEQTPVPTNSTSAIRDTGRYVIDESHELYVEIYDRSTEYTYILYRVPGLDNSSNKLFQQFEYDARVTQWFTDPLKRLHDDGYTIPGHKYYTEPHKYVKKILLHAFAPIIDDYIAPLGYVSASPYAPQTDKNIRILGELRKGGQSTKYVYFTYNVYKKAGQWHCNHRCIEIKPKTEFLATKLEYAKYEVNFPPLK